MALSHMLAALVLATAPANAHFVFMRLKHNDEWQAPSQYIRNKTSPFEEPNTPDFLAGTRRYVDPTYVFDFPESIRCGRDNMAHAADTEVLSIKAGDTIEVAHTRFGPDRWEDEVFNDCPNGRGSCDWFKSDGTMDINHPGPYLAHLSPVPDGQTVQEYDGSGEWVKIHSKGLELKEDGSVHWLPYNNQKLPERFVFEVPKQTPEGEYLLRLDLIWPGIIDPPADGFGDPQIYTSCAHIHVSSDATGPLPKGIKIPEDIGSDSPGMRTSLDMYYDRSLDEGYVYPGGPLWTGEELIEDKPDV